MILLGKSSVVVGTRGSLLAVSQTQWTVNELKKAYDDLDFSTREIVTRGDRILDVALNKIGGKGLFTKEIETALLEGEIDLAVHSLKDLPTELPEGLDIGAITRRVDARDALISVNGSGLSDLAEGARIGTSSLRRGAQLLHHRRDFVIEPIRGNLDTRLKKLEREELDAVVVAAAGLIRLGWEDRITEYLPPEVCVPAVGQGALAIEVRADDPEIKKLVVAINDSDTAACVAAERTVLGMLGGGCQVPIGAYATIADGVLHLQAIVAAVDGKVVIRHSVTGNPDDAEELGKAAANALFEQGARSILKEITAQ